MPVFVECVENNITLGEICNALRGVWGEYVAEGFNQITYTQSHLNLVR